MEDFRQHFSREKAGSWICIEDTTLDLPGGRVQIAPGTRFTRGTTFMGVDIAKQLDEFHDARQPR